MRLISLSPASLFSFSLSFTSLTSCDLVFVLCETWIFISCPGAQALVTAPLNRALFLLAIWPLSLDASASAAFLPSPVSSTLISKSTITEPDLSPVMITLSGSTLRDPAISNTKSCSNLHRDSLPSGIELKSRHNFIVASRVSKMTSPLSLSML